MADGSPTGGAPGNTGANGGAVAAGQGVNPTDAQPGALQATPTGGGVPMAGPNVAPAAPVTTLGPDGEPNPVGNEKQRAAGAAYAATMPKPVQEKVAEQVASEKPAQPGVPQTPQNPSAPQNDPQASTPQKPAGLTPEQQAQLQGR